jgi:hypothetical protein
LEDKPLVCNVLIMGGRVSASWLTNVFLNSKLFSAAYKGDEQDASRQQGLWTGKGN